MVTGVARVPRGGTGPWWLFIVTGVLWILLSLAVLQFSLASVAAISVLFGVVLLAAALNEFLVAVVRRSWRWAHVVLGVLFVGGAVMAFVWPGPTFVTLARLVGWFLLFKGIFDVIGSLAVRVDLWWLGLITGVLEIALAFWAVGYTGRSAVLLVLWVGFAAMLRGITEIVLAFGARAVGKEVEREVRSAEAEDRSAEAEDRSAWPVNEPAAPRPPTSHSAADQPAPATPSEPRPPEA